MSQAPSSILPPKQPKMHQRMLFRFAVGLILLAGLFLVYQWLRTSGQDIDLPLDADTADMIAAVEYLGRGSKVVLFDREGNKRECPGHVEGAQERDVTWRPDGNRVFFVSDREKKAFHVYRWNLASDRVERRSVGTRSKFAPAFGPPGSPGANDAALITAGGFVLEIEPASGHTRQLLPPVPREVEKTDEGGVPGQFESLYQRLGVSFRAAKWTPDKRFVVAVLRREDGSEVLIAQPVFTAAEKAAGAPRLGPIPIAAGAKVDFDVSPVENKVFYCSLGFQFPDPDQIPQQYIKNGRLDLPFIHAVGMVSLNTERPAARFLVTSKDNATAFRSIAISPDGSMAAIVVGSYETNGDFKPESLVVMPAEERGGELAVRVATGRIGEPSWHPNAYQIAFTRTGENGKRSIWVIQRDGRNETRVSRDDGDYGSPKFSPKTKG